MVLNFVIYGVMSAVCYHYIQSQVIIKAFCEDGIQPQSCLVLKANVFFLIVKLKPANAYCTWNLKTHSVVIVLQIRTHWQPYLLLTLLDLSNSLLIHITEAISLTVSLALYFSNLEFSCSTRVFQTRRQENLTSK